MPQQSIRSTSSTLALFSAASLQVALFIILVFKCWLFGIKRFATPTCWLKGVRNQLEIFILNEGYKFPKIETKKSRDEFQFQSLVGNKFAKRTALLAHSIINKTISKHLRAVEKFYIHGFHFMLSYLFYCNL